MRKNKFHKDDEGRRSFFSESDTEAVMLEVSNFVSNVYMRTEAHKLAVDVKWFPLNQWFSNLSEVSNPTGVMQAYIEPLIITRSGSRKF